MCFCRSSDKQVQEMAHHSKTFLTPKDTLKVLCSLPLTSLGTFRVCKARLKAAQQLVEIVLTHCSLIQAEAQRLPLLAQHRQK